MFWGPPTSDTEKLEKKWLCVFFSNAFFDGFTFGGKREVVELIHAHEVFLKNLEKKKFIVKIKRFWKYS